MEGDETLPQDATVPSTVAGTPPGVLPRGTRVGRYELGDPIGRGGFGVVYGAFDPELARKVAIKLVRPDASAPKMRMLREAQAMAKLAHPNVVAVFDVGAFDDQVFVAMELIAGMTLRRWREARERDWREIAAVYAQAARGLAAAHAVDIIHRDFKPDNVLVGDDGRARVLDFGLARATGPASRASRPVVDVLTTPLTMTGAVMGTPAYMSPEQHRGDTTTATTDQFSFCVSLYEALYGGRPFAGTTYDEIAEAVLGGHVAPLPATTRVPAELQALVARGMATAQADRHPSMAAIADALEAMCSAPPPPAVAGRRPLAIAAIAGVLAIAAVVLVLATRSGPHEVKRAPIANGAFDGALGVAMPSGWRFEASGHRATVIHQGCVTGTCLEVTRRTERTPMPDDDIADVSQGIEASGWRGRRVRFSVHVRPEGSDAVAWLRVERSNTSAFADETGASRLVPGQWTTLVIVGDVATDATTIKVGVVHIGDGRTLIDSASLEDVGAEVPLSTKPIEQVPANLGFEDTDDNGVPRGWLVSPWTAHRAQRRVFGDAARSGTRGIRFERRGENTRELELLTQRFDATAYRGKQVRITMATRAANDTSRAELVIDNATNFLSEPQQTDASGWRLHELGAIVPANAELLELLIFVRAFESIDLDDVTVEIVGPAPR